MIKQMLSIMQPKVSNDPMALRRRYSRRHYDHVIATIAGKSYPVEDWGLGGLMISGDGRMFSAGQTLDITLKFKLRNQVLNIAHRAHVVRRSRDKIAFQFEPLTTRIRKGFQLVVDDYVAKRFADSQTA